MSYEQRVAVITGASRGLGKGLAEAFSRLGIRLGLCARTIGDHDSDKLLARSVDVRDADAVNAFTDAVTEHLGPIDLWINNAGVLDPIAPLRDLQPDDIESHLAINVVGVFNGSRSFIRHVHAHRHKAVLINISSGAARHPYFGWSVYCAGKAAVDRLSECIALEEKEIGLRVHSVAPGIIDTDMQSLIRASSADVFPLVAEFRALKEKEEFSSPEFIAKHILDLAFHDVHEDVLVSFPLESEISR